MVKENTSSIAAGFSKRVACTVAALAIATCGFCTMNMAIAADEAQAATPSASKIDAAYKSKAKKLKAKSLMNEFYSWSADLDGNGVKEMVCEYWACGGSGRNFDIYTYKDGAVKPMLKTAEYGWSKIQYSRASNSFRVYRLGHGCEAYYYYKLRNGKYEYVATKARSNPDVTSCNSPWGYSINKVSRSKQEFKKQIAEIHHGKMRTLELDISKPSLW